MQLCTFIFHVASVISGEFSPSSALNSMQVGPVPMQSHAEILHAEGYCKALLKSIDSVQGTASEGLCRVKAFVPPRVGFLFFPVPCKLNITLSM